MPTDTFEGANLDAELNDPAVSIVARLFKNSIALDSDQIVLADLVECDFVGYEAVLLEEPAIDVFAEENYAEAFYLEKEWIAGELLAPQIVYGCYVTITLAGGGTVLNNLQMFDQPIVLDTEGQKIVRNFSVMATSGELS